MYIVGHGREDSILFQCIVLILLIILLESAKLAFIVECESV
jgi:hypothetical protein